MESVYQEIRDLYEMVECGAADIKGKGRMTTYKVDAHRSREHFASKASNKS